MEVMIIIYHHFIRSVYSAQLFPFGIRYGKWSNVELPCMAETNRRLKGQIEASYFEVLNSEVVSISR